MNRKSTGYNAWSSMRQRTSNPKIRMWHRYGGRGITVCERWNSFENFIADMGPRPSLDHSIDRIDSDGNYEPDNCRWATRSEQAQNRKPLVGVAAPRSLLNAAQVELIRSSRKTGVELAKTIGVSATTISRVRLRRNYRDCV